MQNSRDSSVWRTLAVAFGDGLAFGVGVTLTRGAVRLAANRSATAELRANNGWNQEVEQRSLRAPETAAAPAAPAPVANAAGAVVPAIEKRLTETSDRIDRRLTDLESKLQQELDALDAQDHELAEGVEARFEALRDQIAGDMRGLRAQMTVVHKEFAETFARLVDEQIAKTIATRMEVLEGELRETIRREVRAADQTQQMAELRELLETQELSVQNLVLTLGHQAVEKTPPITAQENRLQESPAGGHGSEQSLSAETADADLPGFARTRTRKPLWKVPIVPSFLAVTGSLLLLHYL